MMSKHHKQALRDLLKERIDEIAPGFNPTRDAAKLFGTPRAFAYESKHAGRAFYILFEDTAVNADDYFELNIAWFRDASKMMSIPDCAHNAVELKRGFEYRETASNLISGYERADFLWDFAESDVNYLETFHFPTASSKSLGSNLIKRRLDMTIVSQYSIEQSNEMTVEKATGAMRACVTECLTKIELYVIPFFENLDRRDAR
jgi:hypothetical protein